MSCLWRDLCLILLEVALCRVSLVALHAVVSFLSVRPGSLNLGQRVVLVGRRAAFICYRLRSMVNGTHLVTRVRTEAARCAVSNLACKSL